MPKCMEYEPIWKLGSGSWSGWKVGSWSAYQDQIKIRIQIRIQIHIKMISRIGIRIYLMRIRNNTSCNSTYRGVFYCIEYYRTSFLRTWSPNSSRIFMAESNGLPTLFIAHFMIRRDYMFQLCSHFEFECLQEFEIINWKCSYCEWEIHPELFLI